MPQSKKGKYSSRLSDEKKLGNHESFRTHDGFYRMMIDSLDGQSIFTTDKGGGLLVVGTQDRKNYLDIKKKRLSVKMFRCYLPLKI